MGMQKKRRRNRHSRWNPPANRDLAALDAEYQLMEQQISGILGKMRQNRANWQKIRHKIIAQARRDSDTRRIWSPGEPPMTYREHERSLQRARRRRLAAENDDFRLDPTPLPGDRFRKQGQ